MFGCYHYIVKTPACKEWQGFPRELIRKYLKLFEKQWGAKNYTVRNNTKRYEMSYTFDKHGYCANVTKIV